MLTSHSDDRDTATRNENAEMRTARRIIENTSANLFLTGKAGTGKTTFLHSLRSHSSKRMIVLAPTGIAAINARGVTIHSFFQLALSPFIPGATQTTTRKRFDRFSREKLRLIRTIDLLVIDEVSMVRADLLDAVDDVLRRHRNPTLPFGGVQLLLIGDLQQLPPVVPPEQWELLNTVYSTPYFFSSKALNEAGYLTVELHQVYRQNDNRFIDLLNRIRTNHIDRTTLDLLNSRCDPSFSPDASQGYIRLTTHNRRADEINRCQLDALDTPAQTYTAEIEGDFPETSLPTDRTLTLKVGAQVKFLKNDSVQGYFNGMMAHVIDLTPTTVIVRPIGSSNKIEVGRAIWENTDYKLDTEKATVEETICGTFSQIPLRLAWAITIHKSQGLTFDKAIIDATNAFAHGQTYVALSRCRSLEGLVLDRPIPQSAIILDPAVDSFNAAHVSLLPDQTKLTDLEAQYTIECLDSLFSPVSLRNAFNRLHRIVEEYFSRDYVILARSYKEADSSIAERIEKVAHAFAVQYRGIIPGTPLFQERLDKAFRYFSEELRPLLDLIVRTPETADNKAVAKRLREARNELSEIVRIKLAVMQTLSGQSFAPASYLSAKAKATLALDSAQPTKSRPSRAAASAAGAGHQPAASSPASGHQPASSTSGHQSANASSSSDIADPILYEKLCNWRTQLSKENACPAYIILSNRALIAISSIKPVTLPALKAIPGIGNKKLTQYGPQIIQIVLSHLSAAPIHPV